MIPGMNSGETAFKRYQEQVHRQIEEPLRRKIEHFMDHCCMEAEGITNTDIEELKEMAALMDPDEQIGLLRRIEDMDTGASGLKDRQTALTAKGIIEGYIRSTWYEENRPRSTTADAIEQGLQHFRENSYEDFIKEHPEAAPKTTINEENLLKQIKDLSNSLEELRQNNEKMMQEMNKLRAINGQEIESPIPEPENAQNVSKIIRNENLLKFRTERSWLVSFLDEEYKEIDLEYAIKAPESFDGYIPLRISIENEDGGRRVAMMQFDVHVSGKEQYEMLFNRLRGIITQYLLTGEVDTSIPLHEDFSEKMNFYPKLEGGDIWRLQIGKIDPRHFREDAVLAVTLGDGHLRYSVFVKREYLETFLDNVSDLVEIILKSGEAEKARMG